MSTRIDTDAYRVWLSNCRKSFQSRAETDSGIADLDRIVYEHILDGPGILLRSRDLSTEFLESAHRLICKFEISGQSVRRRLIRLAVCFVGASITATAGFIGSLFELSEASQALASSSLWGGLLFSLICAIAGILVLWPAYLAESLERLHREAYQAEVLSRLHTDQDLEEKVAQLLADRDVSVRDTARNVTDLIEEHLFAEMLNYHGTQNHLRRPNSGWASHAS